MPGIFEIETIEELQNNWRDPYLLWWSFGMPSFTAENKEPWKQIKVKFKTKEDREAFGELVQQQLTEKTNTIWVPEKQNEKNNMNRFIEE